MENWEKIEKAMNCLSRYINENDSLKLPKDIHVKEAYDILGDEYGD